MHTLTLPSMDQLRSQFGSLPPIVLPEGHRIGNYEIVVPIDHGDAVTGYAAFDERDGSEVRLMEFLPRDLCRRGDDGNVAAPVGDSDRGRFLAGSRRFLNQGRTLAHLEAPGLTRVRDCWSAQGTCYLAAVADAGRRLDAWRPHQDEAPGEFQMWRFAQRLLEALEALHSVHCLHLEVSPPCIVIAHGTEPVLLEASSAWRLLENLDAGSRAQYQGHFAAPELHAGFTRGELVGPWTDIYGLAATMFWLATGDPPPRAADRSPADAAQALVHLTRGRYSHDLLAAIDEGLSLDLRVRARWAARWREVARQTGQARARGGTGLDDIVLRPPQVPGPLAPSSADCMAGRAVRPKALPASEPDQAWPGLPAPAPAPTRPVMTRRSMRLRAMAVFAIGSLGVLAAQPLSLPPALHGAALRGGDAAIKAQSIDGPATPGAARQGLEAPPPRFSRPNGHVTAALDIGPDGRVVTVAVLASDPPGLADSEVIRSLLLRQFEATGASERTTIDIAVPAVAD